MIGSDSRPALARSSANAVSTALTELASPNSPDEERGMSLLRLVDLRQDRVDLVRGVVGVTADLELDQGRSAALGDLRRADVLDGFHARDVRDRVLDRCGESGISRLQRGMLDEHALARGLLEALVEDLVHATGLTRPGRVRINEIRPDRAAEKDGDDDEREPAECRGLPVVGAPSAHPRRQVVGPCRGHELPPSSFGGHAIDGREAVARTHRRKAGIRLGPSDEPVSYPGRRRPASTWSTFKP